MALTVSKANLYAVLAPPDLTASKASLYAVLAPPALTASKASLYAVLTVPSAPSWATFTFGGGVVGTAYSQSFSASGSPGITYSVVTGSLPTGLTLSGATISGTPTVAAAYTFTLRATNSYGTADIACGITVVSPGGGAHGWTY